MTEPSRIRAVARDGVADVRVRMAHDMESGQRKDASGAVVPAWHISEVQATLNGKPVLKAWWGPSISKNPFLRFKVRGAKPGDRLSIAWVDNRGASRSDETTVS
jgi:sulfur-oxidizing protein SoxZ